MGLWCVWFVAVVLIATIMPPRVIPSDFGFATRSPNVRHDYKHHLRHSIYGYGLNYMPLCHYVVSFHVFMVYDDRTSTIPRPCLGYASFDSSNGGNRGFNPPLHTLPPSLPFSLPPSLPPRVTSRQSGPSSSLPFLPTRPNQTISFISSFSSLARHPYHPPLHPHPHPTTPRSIIYNQINHRHPDHLPPPICTHEP